MNIIKEFQNLLYSHKKVETIDFALNLLREGKINVKNLYEDILTPALNDMQCDIWSEHLRSSVVRSIVESCYSFVQTEKMEKGHNKEKKVVIMCPPNEQHELGARMISDFFELEGYDSIFIGANTPKFEFVNSLNNLNPDYLVISVTNPYHLFSTKEIIKNIRKTNENVKILVGGYAFSKDKDRYIEVNADKLISGYEDIQNLHKEVQL